MRLLPPTLEPKDGFTYEPCVLWGRMYRERLVGPIGEGTPTVVENFVPFGQEDFYNSSPWPIVITHMIVMSKPLESAVPYSTWDDFSQPEIQRPSVRISRMGTTPFSLMDQIGAVAWLGSTQSGPRSKDARVTDTNPNANAFLDGFNTVRWELALPITTPGRGMLQFDLAGTPPLLEVVPDSDTVRTVNVRATAQFYEVANAPQQTPANSRSHVSDMVAMSERDARKFTSPLATLAAMSISGTEFSLPNPYGNPPSTWDNGYGMPKREFIAQQAPVNRSSSVSAMQFAFTKVNEDGVVTFLPTAGNIGVPQQFRAQTNLAQSIYSRAKVAQGGTNTWFWRAGAPLAICMPTITPAPVYRFPKPIELNMGEGLDVTGLIPTDGLYRETEFEISGDLYSYASHVFYVSFCGYRCISTKR